MSEGGCNLMNVTKRIERGWTKNIRKRMLPSKRKRSRKREKEKEKKRRGEKKIIG